MDTFAGAGTFAPRNHVPARILIAVTRRAVRTDHFNFEAAPSQPLRQIFADQKVVLTRWIKRWNLD